MPVENLTQKEALTIVMNEIRSRNEHLAGELQDILARGEHVQWKEYPGAPDYRPFTTDESIGIVVSFLRKYFIESAQCVDSAREEINKIEHLGRKRHVSIDIEIALQGDSQDQDSKPNAFKPDEGITNNIQKYRDRYPAIARSMYSSLIAEQQDNLLKLKHILTTLQGNDGYSR